MKTPSSLAPDLDALARAARHERAGWDDARAARILAGAIAVRDRRAARSKLARRSVAFLSATSVVIVMLLRGASAPASTSPDAAEHAGGGALAANGDLPGDGDGGYRRD